MEKAYDALAAWFEELNDDCDYPAWSQYFIETLRRIGAGNLGLELGCGTGYFCRALKRAGYSMSGADISLPMLSRAEFLARKEGLSIPFFRADAAALKTPGKFDFILSPNDCFNYLPPEKLFIAFRHVRECLKTGGVFMFDVSSEYKLRKKVADTVSADDRENVTYLSFNTLSQNRVEMEVSLFVKGDDGRYDRFDERHIQYIHSEEFVLDALSPAGFREIIVEGNLGEEKTKSDRLNFICRK